MTVNDQFRRPDHCAWAGGHDPLDWVIARRAVFCAGQNGCKEAGQCCDRAQDMFFRHGRALIRHTMLGGERPGNSDATALGNVDRLSGRT